MLCANAATFGHADFALIADALLHVKDGIDGLVTGSQLLEIGQITRRPQD
jgi:hypothetical protein